MSMSMRWIGWALLGALVIGCGGEKAGPDPSTSGTPVVTKSSASARASSSAGMTTAPPPPSASAVAVGSASARPSAGKPFSSADAFGSSGLGLTGIGEGGGCPCGCDRSERMLAELRAEGGRRALDVVDFSLRTIGAREDAGYITERMVQHRLRLLGLDAELGGAGCAGGGGSTVRCGASVGPRATATTATSGTTRVRAELIVHAEGTEIVNDEPKLLKACFLVRMDVTNTSTSAITVHTPTIDTTGPGGGAPFEVSRWYVAGTAGEPWDGVVPPGASAQVNVIGYAGKPLRAGDDVQRRSGSSRWISRQRPALAGAGTRSRSRRPERAPRPPRDQFARSRRFSSHPTRSPRTFSFSGSLKISW